MRTTNTTQNPKLPTRVAVLRTLSHSVQGGRLAFGPRKRLFYVTVFRVKMTTTRKLHRISRMHRSTIGSSSPSPNKGQRNDNNTYIYCISLLWTFLWTYLFASPNHGLHTTGSLLINWFITINSAAAAAISIALLAAAAQQRRKGILGCC